MNEKNSPIVVCFGLPVLFTMHLIEETGPDTVMWMICDTDIHALTIIDDHYRNNNNVLFCIVDHFDTRTLLSVLDILQGGSYTENDCILLSGICTAPLNSIQFLHRMDFENMNHFDGANAKLRPALSLMDVDMVRKVLLERLEEWCRQRH